MRRLGPAVLLALTGAAILRVALFSDLYLRYVQAGLRPYLVVSGAVLVVLAAVAAVASRTDAGHTEAAEHPAPALGDGGTSPAPALGDVGTSFAPAPGDGGTSPAPALGDVGTSFAPAPGDGGTSPTPALGDGGTSHAPVPADGGTSHAHGPRVAWLLTLPALALLLFPPPALGSYSAEREAAERAARGVGTFPALPAGDPLDLPVGEFASRAVYDSERSLRGRTLRLTGFVTRDDDGTWYVTRLLISCCAADATTAKAEVRGAAAPPADTWVTVTGTWHPEGALGSDAAWPPVLDATGVRRTAQPANPYEKR
ncbi:TIGR03943 family putative permease subunit [Streptomyces sp. NPDC085946]|uniref:TIGR03943 family putative permease subunit n=1 Tax=Streptomyces sp. NPDC085946 TaxID=3365744 RepID=UPI0037CDF368